MTQAQLKNSTVAVVPPSFFQMASSIVGFSSTVADDGNGDDTPGTVTHDIGVPKSSSSSSKVRKRCKNNNNDDEDDGNGDNNKYARGNEDDDVSSCRTMEVPDDTQGNASLSTILYGLVETEQYETILRVAIYEGVISRQYGHDICWSQGQEKQSRGILETVKDLGNYYSSKSNGAELLNKTIHNSRRIDICDDDSDTGSDGEEGGDASDDNTTIVGSNISNDKYSVDGCSKEDDDLIDFTNDHGGGTEMDTLNHEQHEEFGYEEEVVNINSGLAKQPELEVVGKDSANNLELCTNVDECNGTEIKDVTGINHDKVHNTRGASPTSVFDVPDSRSTDVSDTNIERPTPTKEPIVSDPIREAAAAYDSDPIPLNEYNAKHFLSPIKRQLYKITGYLPSITDQTSLGIRLQHNSRFGRAMIVGISNTSSLFDQIPPVFRNGYIIVAVVLDGKICQSSNIHTITNEINNARSQSHDKVKASIILAKSCTNTHEEATVQLRLKLKLENFKSATPLEQEEIQMSSKVFGDYLCYLYDNKQSDKCKRFFFEDLNSFQLFKDSHNNAKIGGVYIGEKQLHLPLKFGTSLYNCKNRDERQKLRQAWMFCTKDEALKIVPPRFVNHLMELSNLPCVHFNPDNDLTKQQLCAILLVEAALSSIHPTITGTVGDYFVQAPSNHIQAKADPPISQSRIDKICKGEFLKPGDHFHIFGSWPTFTDDTESLRKLDGYALLNHHLPNEVPDFLKLFLYKQLLGPTFHGWTDCVEWSPWLIRLQKVVKNLEQIMAEGDILSVYEKEGTVDSATAKRLDECLADMIKFAKEHNEYEPPSDAEVAAGCAEKLSSLQHPDNVVYVIETSTYKALKGTKFYKEYFRGCKIAEVLKNDRLKFIKHTNGRRIVVVGTPFVAYAEKTELPARHASIESQNAFSKILSSLGLRDAAEAAKFRNVNRSYLSCLHFGSKVGAKKVEEGRFHYSRRLHLPSNMCKGHVPAGLKCLQHLLPLPFRSILLLRDLLGQLQFNLVLTARGGKIGPKQNTPVEMNNGICSGIFEVGRFAAIPCTCQSPREFCMFMARNQDHPLFGHITCLRCDKTLHNRVKTITAEAKRFGIGINRVVALQPLISAVLSTRGQTELMNDAMKTAGFSEQDTNDDNLQSLLIEWTGPGHRNGTLGHPSFIEYAEKACQRDQIAQNGPLGRDEFERRMAEYAENAENEEKACHYKQLAGYKRLAKMEDKRSISISVVKSSNDAKLGLEVSGIKVSGKTYLKVTNIAPTSIFYETSLRVGDALLSINGMTYGSYNEGLVWLKTTSGSLTLKVINQAEL